MLNRVLKIFAIASVLFLSSIATTLAQDNLVKPCSSEAQNPIRLAVVARGDSIESMSLYKGVLEACENSEWKTPVKVDRLVYDNDKEGFELVSRIVREGSADVIIGPTDSSLYADLVEFLKFEKIYIPIISPAVTVELGNDPNSWFFRTNVNAIDRARTMSDYLLSKSVENLALLYTDNTFGEISEAAFRQNLAYIPDTKMNSFRFSSLNDAWPLIQQINTLRPEAIGIIGSRQEVDKMSTRFKGPHNEWNAFNPYIFTIVDTRGLELDGIHFLSVGTHGTLESGEASGELLDLSFDTTSLILMIADDMLSRGNLPGSGAWPEEFRKRLVGAMSGSISKLPSRTDMEFVNLQNIAKPKVMTTKGDQVQVETPSLESGWLKAGKNWLEIRKRRFGIAPIVNITLISVIVLLLTVFDLKKSHRVSNRNLLRFSFVTLVLLNVSLAILLFIYTAEIGVLEWDSVFGALLLAFGYSGLLKTTIFESATGNSIGLKHYYDLLVEMIYDNIRKQQFEKVGPIINYIAYANTRAYLLSTLHESYTFAGDTESIQTLRKKLQVKLDKHKTILGQRKALARAIFEELSWAKLQERRIVPRNTKAEDILDPEPIVDDSVKYCFRKNRDCLGEVEKLIDEMLDNPAYVDLKSEFMEDLDSSNTPLAKITSCIRWSILLLGYDLQLMIGNDLLPADYELNNLTNEFSNKFKLQAKKLERRTATRIHSWNTQVQVSFDNKEVKGQIVDISEGGVRVLLDKNAQPLPINLHLTTTADDAAVKLENVQAKLINNNQRDDDKTLIGLCWESLSERSRGNINEYLQTALEA